MAISTTPVQQAGAAWSSGTTVSITLGANPTNGNILVLCWGATSTSGQITSISQTGATWVLAGRSNTARCAEIWYAKNVSGALAAITVNITGTTSTFNGAVVSEWSGCDITAPLDGSAVANSNTGTSPGTGSITPTASENALIISSVQTAAATTAGPTNSFTEFTDPNARTRPAYLVVASTSGSYSTSYTAGSASYDAEIAVFKATTTAAGLFLPNPMNGLGVGGPFFSNPIG